MRLPARLRVSPEQRRHLVDVARGTREPDAVVHARNVLNVYTSETGPAEIGIASGRIAWVVPIAEARGPCTVELDGVVLPGFIEPHCHPDILYTPAALVPQLVAHGTTTVCADTAFLTLALDDDELVAVLEEMSTAAVKFLWNLRCCMDGVLPRERERFATARLQRLIDDIDAVVATGEMTAWPDLLDHDERLTTVVDSAAAEGLRIDGHAAGASPRSLGAIAAAGITADHEAISAGDLVNRTRLGYWTMLRHSSLRPDVDALVTAITSGDVPHWRTMLTTDGPIATDLVSEGHLDAILRRLIDRGVDPADAVRMATLHPATYLGLDAHIGGIAPGRCADLVHVDSLESFEVADVATDGHFTDTDHLDRGFTAWSTLTSEPLRTATIKAADIIDGCIDGPAFRLEGIITRRAARSARLPRDACYVAAVSRDGTRLVGAVVHGIDVPVLVSTFSGSGDVVLLGRDAEGLVDAYRRVVDLGGGLATEHHIVPLGALGSLYDGPMHALATAMHAVASDLQLPASLPPIEYLMLFLTLAVLPEIRLTPRGSLMVKTGAVLRAPDRLVPETVPER